MTATAEVGAPVFPVLDSTCGRWTVLCTQTTCPEPHWVKPDPGWPQIHYRSKRAAEEAAAAHRARPG